MPPGKRHSLRLEKERKLRSIVLTISERWDGKARCRQVSQLKIKLK